MVHPDCLFHLPDEFAKLSAFSFSVHLSLKPGELIIDLQRAVEATKDLLEEVSNLFILKRGNLEYLVDHYSIPVEVKLSIFPKSVFSLILISFAGKRDFVTV